MFLNIRRLESFLKDYQDLSNEEKAKVEKALRLFIENPRHPSLQVKRIQGTSNIWEARVDLKQWITFLWNSNLLILRRIGNHDIVNKEAKRGD